MSFRVAGVPFKRYGVEGASLVADVACNTTELLLCQYVIAPYELRVGTTFLVEGACNQTGANAARCNPGVRCGPVTMTGSYVAGFSAGGAVGTGAVSSYFKMLLTMRTIGAAGTMVSSICQLKDGTQIEDECSSSVVVDTTVRNYLEFVFSSGNVTNTYTFKSASITKVVA